jgi:hypothetical protein
MTTRAGSLVKESVPTMSRLRCLFRRHDWLTVHDEEANQVWRECRRCGVVKVTLNEMWDRSSSTFWGLGGG